MLGLIGASVALLISSIASYPGGTSLDRTAPGHDLLRNFLCDLTAPVALNGAANPKGAALATIGILLLGLALVLFWWTLAGLVLAAPGARSLVRATGVASAVAMTTLPLTRQAPLVWFHPGMVLIAVIPGLIAAGTCIFGLSRCGRLWRPVWVLGLSTLIVASVDSVLYVIHLLTRNPVILALPALQRLATLMFLVFVCAAALRMRAPGSVGRAAIDPQ